MSMQMSDQFTARLEELERKRDPEPLLALFSEDVELSRAPQDHAYRGLAAARAFWDEYLHMFPEVETAFDTITASGGRAALEWHSTCRLEDGSKVSYRGCTVIESSGDRVTRVRTYYDSAVLLGMPKASS